MKKILIIVSLKEKKALTHHAKLLHMSRCTFIHKALCLFQKQMRRARKIHRKRKRHV